MQDFESMRRPRKVTMKPSRKGQALLPLATRAVAARPNSPNARQPLPHSKKIEGFESQRTYNVPRSVQCPDVATYWSFDGSSGTIPNRQNRQGLPSDTASNSYESLLVHRPITVTGSKTIAPKSSSHDTPKEGPDHRSISTSVAF